MKNTLFLRIYGGFCIIIAGAAALILLFSFRAIRSAYLDDQAAHLEGLAEILKPAVVSSLDRGRAQALEQLAGDVERGAQVRVTVVDATGTVLADSEEAPGRMESHQYRPEIFRSLKGEPARAVRRSSTVKADMLYMSFPLFEGGKVVGALRLSRFMKDIDGLLAHLRRRIVGTALGVMALVFLAMLFFSRVDLAAGPGIRDGFPESGRRGFRGQGFAPSQGRVRRFRAELQHDDGGPEIHVLHLRRTTRGAR